MLLIVSSILGCALFEKQTLQQGEEPTGLDSITQDTGASTNGSDTGSGSGGNGSDTSSGSGGNGSDTSSGSGGNGSGGNGSDTGSGSGGGNGSGVSNHMNSSNSSLAQGVDCTGDYSAYDYTNAAECFTDFISCGDQILMSTGGGTSYYDQSLFTDWYESGNGKNTDYSGEERAFYFLHPGNGAVVVTLESPCEDTDLFYFKAYDMGDCYEEGCVPCRQDNKSSQKTYYQNDSFQIYDTNSNEYLFIVESASGADVPFVLSVECP